MEKRGTEHKLAGAGDARQAGAATPAAPAWREGLPALSRGSAVLRELVSDDAPALLAHLGTEEAFRFMAPLPVTVAGFEEFIEAAQRGRAAGECVTFGVVPKECDHVVGFFQVRALEMGFANAEWTFVLGSDYWGSGLFLDGARLVLDFSFDSLGVVRLEARAVTVDGRGNGALRKIGAVQEGVLRRAFKRNGQRHDQLLWAVLAEDWRHQRRDRGRVVH